MSPERVWRGGGGPHRRLRVEPQRLAQLGAAEHRVARHAVLGALRVALLQHVTRVNTVLVPRVNIVLMTRDTLVTCPAPV